MIRFLPLSPIIYVKRRIPTNIFRNISLGVGVNYISCYTYYETLRCYHCIQNVRLTLKRMKQFASLTTVMYGIIQFISRDKSLLTNNNFEWSSFNFYLDQNSNVSIRIEIELSSIETSSNSYQLSVYVLKFKYLQLLKILFNTGEYKKKYFKLYTIGQKISNHYSMKVLRSFTNQKQKFKNHRKTNMVLDLLRISTNSQN